jgi:hypothetical protein
MGHRSIQNPWLHESIISNSYRVSAKIPGRSSPASSATSPMPAQATLAIILEDALGRGARKLELGRRLAHERQPRAGITAQIQGGGPIRSLVVHLNKDPDPRLVVLWAEKDPPEVSGTPAEVGIWSWGLSEVPHRGICVVLLRWRQGIHIHQRGSGPELHGLAVSAAPQVAGAGKLSLPGNGEPSHGEQGIADPGILSRRSRFRDPIQGLLGCGMESAADPHIPVFINPAAQPTSPGVIAVDGEIPIRVRDLSCRPRMGKCPSICREVVDRQLVDHGANDLRGIRPAAPRDQALLVCSAGQRRDRDGSR